MAYRAGQAHGLEILLSISQSDYLCTSQFAGFKIDIHNYLAASFPEAWGLNVAPGNRVAISLTKVNMIGFKYY